MYHNILVPISLDHVEAGKRAIENAQAMSAPGATITLLHVMEDIPGYAKAYFAEGFLETRQKELQVQLSALTEGYSDMRAYVVQGHASETIIDFAEQDRSDLIIVASHHRGLTAALIGSTASDVVREGTCSVLVVR